MMVIITIRATGWTCSAHDNGLEHTTMTGATARRDAWEHAGRHFAQSIRIDDERMGTSYIEDPKEEVHPLIDALELDAWSRIAKPCDADGIPRPSVVKFERHHLKLLTDEVRRLKILVGEIAK